MIYIKFNEQQKFKKLYATIIFSTIQLYLTRRLNFRDHNNHGDSSSAYRTAELIWDMRGSDPGIRFGTADLRSQDPAFQYGLTRGIEALYLV